MYFSIHLSYLYDVFNMSKMRKKKKYVRRTYNIDEVLNYSELNMYAYLCIVYI